MNSFSRPFFLIVFCLGVFAAGCASQSTVPEPQPMPADKDFSGVWYSPQFEHMHLRQSGGEVSGIYTYQDGGRIEGEVDGNILIFEWVEPGDKEKAQRTMQGRGYLQLVEEADTFELVGEWGYTDQVSGAGPWEAEWVRELESDDPLTLQGLQEQRD